MIDVKYVVIAIEILAAKTAIQKGVKIASFFPVVKS